ncbi:TauD/TfdA family dioxygenase [Streptomyces cyaneofuscatus]|uniref:TauD/TfdA family dioxygenase n=1 Tax=Streptomyces cyaneofuscatus TaxID=66883 RepID=UPI00345D7680
MSITHPSADQSRDVRIGGEIRISRVEDVREDRLDVLWSDGGRSQYWAHWIRLRATAAGLFTGVARNWSDGANFHPQQRLVSESDRIERAHTAGGGAYLVVTWRDGTSDRLAAPDIWSAEHDDPARRIERKTWSSTKTWPSWDFGPLIEDPSREVLLAFLTFYLEHGVALISNVPRRVDSLARVAGGIAALAPSHLGDAFDIRTTDNPKHIGEVAAGIPLHIDLVYRQFPPSVQALHAINQIEDGGENELVDIHHILGQMAPEDIELLSTIPVDFVARSTSVHFRGRHPVLQFDLDGNFTGVAYNQYKISFPPSVPPAYYFAFERFRRMIHAPENVNRMRIPQDAVLVFDNRRTLHGRRSFRDTSRHVIGCFLSDDDLRSRYRLLAEAASGGQLA